MRSNKLIDTVKIDPLNRLLKSGLKLWITFTSFMYCALLLIADASIRVHPSDERGNRPINQGMGVVVDQTLLIPLPCGPFAYLVVGKIPRISPFSSRSIYLLPKRHGRTCVFVALTLNQHLY